MIRHLVLSVVALGALIGRSAVAQQSPRIEVTPYAGYMVFGDFVNGPLGTSISNAGGPLLGAQLGVALTPNIAVVGNAARASGDIKLGIPFLDGISVGSSSAWMFDGALQLSLPLTERAFTPFVQLGAGAMRHEVNIGLSTDATNFVGTVGAGADFRLTRAIGLRVMAKDYIGRFDVREATTLPYEPGIAHNFGFSAGLKIAF
ncbi:MAG TPA: outer membrane beta-barrel protein [Gemmatimonadaceae bacterium]|nr:outer membrane beta-barrel protein [Gemmatimonadaceae bacterium]